MLTRGAHDERAGDIYTAAGANVGEMGDDMGVRSNIDVNIIVLFSNLWNLMKALSLKENC